MSVRLAADPEDYVRGLTAFRDGDVAGWVADFAEATAHATVAAQRFLADLRTLVKLWRERIGGRDDAAAVRLLVVLPGFPVVDSSTVAHRLNVSVQTALTALHTLESTGILTPMRASRRGQGWRADDIIDLLTDFDHRVSGRRGERADDDAPSNNG